MDTLTHALSGALLARASAPQDAPPRSIPRRVAAGFFACAAPDLDFVIGFAGPAEFLLYHRGVTHSLLLAPLWALPLAWILAKVLREPGGWHALYGVCTLAICAHIAGDWITSFGTMVLAPFSDWRAGIGTTFIIDLWFSGIILAGLVLSALLYKTRMPSVVAVIVLCGYIGFQSVQKQKALEFGLEYAQRRGISGAAITAHPRPVSPYNWTVFVSDGEAHHYAHVNLARESVRDFRPGDGFVAKLDAAYRPLALAEWQARSRSGDGLAREAWLAPGLGFFRWFAELPAFDGWSEERRCAWFLDLRFLIPGREYAPFRFGACRDAPGGEWRAYESDPERGAVALD